jgi:hypothetical protein
MSLLPRDQRIVGPYWCEQVKRILDCGGIRKQRRDQRIRETIPKRLLREGE